MADKAMDVYLNDHLAGAMLGRDLADQIRSHNEGTSLGELMGQLAPQIEEDRQTLITLMANMNSVQESGQAGRRLGDRKGQPTQVPGHEFRRA